MDGKMKELVDGIIEIRIAVNGLLVTMNGQNIRVCQDFDDLVRVLRGLTMTLEAAKEYYVSSTAPNQAREKA